MTRTMLAAVLLTGCTEQSVVERCVYLDAFEQVVPVETLTGAQGRADAERMIAEGRAAIVGGYAEEGPLTVLLRTGQLFPEDALANLIRKVGIRGVDKRYLTRQLNDSKSGTILDSDDGRVGGVAVERECYTPSVRHYAIAFNDAMLSGAGR